MLALPLQGFAAASMLYCGMNSEHHAVAVAETPSAPASHRQHATSAQVENHDHSHASATPAPHDAQPQLPDATHKCGVCAACCNLVAMASPPMLVATTNAPELLPPEPLALNYAAPSRLPEKPPRS